MDRMDAEYEERERRAESQKKVVLTGIAKLEKENGEKLKTALSRARAYMGIGNRKAAVDTLEAVQEVVPWQTDLGGAVQLEYAMALETVDRTEEARQIYGKLAVVSWSNKIKGQAVQLLQGLEITKQIRKDTSPGKPFMDLANMYKVSEALKPGLTNQWDAYDSDKRRKYYKVSTWYDEGTSAVKPTTPEITQIVTLSDAYSVLTRALNPLKPVDKELVYRSFRRILSAMDIEIAALLRSRGVVRTSPTAKTSPVTIPTTSITSSSTSTSSGSNNFVTQMSNNLNRNTFQTALSTMNSEQSYTVVYTKDLAAESAPKPIVNMTSISSVFFGSLNGTWVRIH